MFNTSITVIQRKQLSMIKKELEKSVNEIKETGTITANKPIFIDFNDYARNLGLDVAFSTFKESKISHAGVQVENGKSKSVSTISIFLKTTKNLKENDIDPQNNNWDSKYKHTKDLIVKWHELLNAYSYPPDYITDPTLIFIYSLESVVVVKLVYLCRDNILKWIEKEKLRPKPEYLFCSSEPAFNIVFKNKEEFELSKETTQKMLAKYIHQLFESSDCYNYYEDGKVKFYMLHKEMEGISLYGLSRQD